MKTIKNQQLERSQYLSHLSDPASIAFVPLLALVAWASAAAINCNRPFLVIARSIVLPKRC